MLRVTESFVGKHTHGSLSSGQCQPKGFNNGGCNWAWSMICHALRYECVLLTTPCCGVPKSTDPVLLCELFVTGYNEAPDWAWRLGLKEWLMGLSFKARLILWFESLPWEPTFKASIVVSPGDPGRWALGSSQTRLCGSQSLEKPGCFSIVGGCAGSHQGDQLWDPC